MKKYLIGIRSVFAIVWCKLIYGNRFRIGGLPVSVRCCNISVYKNSTFCIGKRLNVYGNSELVCLNEGFLNVGDAVFINRNCNIVCRKNIKIGDCCRFGPNVCIYDHDHEYNYSGVTDSYKLGDIIIEKNCWLGANAVILRDSHIGEGSVIGAGVVIKGCIPPHSLVYFDKSNIVIKQIKNDICNNNNI